MFQLNKIGEKKLQTKKNCIIRTDDGAVIHFFDMYLQKQSKHWIHSIECFAQNEFKLLGNSIFEPLNNKKEDDIWFCFQIKSSDVFKKINGIIRVIRLKIENSVD